MLMRKATVTVKFIVVSMVLVFAASFLALELLQVKQSEASLLSLPEPNSILESSHDYSLAQLKGLKIDLNNPYNLSFIIEHGDQKSLSQESATELIRFFMAALAVPRKELWVNLSPYENNRIINSTLEETELGEVFLKQDYILKQLSSSLTDPDAKLGKEYWNNFSINDSRLSAKSNAFSKIWISPEGSELFLKDDTVIINSASLKVQTESDYLAMKKNGIAADKKNGAMGLILEELSREVNEGKHFARLRQVYNALILADWFKKTLKDSVYSNYIDGNAMSDLDLAADDIKEKVWQLYCKSFNDGVYKTIRKDNKVKRSYFSGGMGFDNMGNQKTMASPIFNDPNLSEINIRTKMSSSFGLLDPTRADLGAALRTINLENGELKSMMLKSLTDWFGDKDKIKELKKKLKAGDVSAYNALLERISAEDMQQNNIRAKMIDLFTNISANAIPYKEINISRLNTLTAYALLYALGVKTQYYESKNGPVLLKGKLGAKDTVLFDLKQGIVLNMPAIVKDYYRKDKGYLVVSDLKTLGYKYENSKQYQSEVAAANRSIFTDADIYENYPYLRKLDLFQDIVKEVLSDFASAFKKLNNVAKYEELLKKSNNLLKAKDKLDALISEYKQNSKDAKRKSILASINKSLSGVSYDKEYLLKLSKFYYEIKDLKQQGIVFERMARLEPRNTLNILYRVKTLIRDNSKDHEEDLNALLKRLLVLKPAIHEERAHFLGLDVLNALCAYDQKLFQKEDNKTVENIKHLISILQNAIKDGVNKKLDEQLTSLLVNIDKGVQVSTESVEKLKEAGLADSLYILLDKLVGRYNERVNNYADTNVVVSKLKQELSNTKAEKEAVVVEKNRVIEQDKEKDATILALNTEVSELNSEVNELKESMNMQMMQFAEERKKLSAEKVNAANQALQASRQQQNEAQKRFDDYTAVNEIDKFSILQKELGKGFDKIFQIVADENRSKESIANRALEWVGQKLRIMLWFFDVKQVDTKLAFKANVQDGFKRQSFFKEMVVAESGEKAYVAEVYNAFYNKNDGNGGLRDTTIEERKQIVSEFNKRAENIGVCMIHASADYSQLSVNILDRTKLPEEFKNPGEVDGSGGYKGDVNKYSNAEVSKDKIKQLAFVFLDRETMIMWNNWMPGQGKYEPSKLAEGEKSNFLQHQIFEILSGLRNKKDIFYEKYRLYQELKKAKEEVSSKSELLDEAKEKLENAQYDKKTELFSSDHYQDSKELIYTSFTAQGLPVSEIEFDIDFFKKFNDKYGHDNADIVLKKVAEIIIEHSKDYPQAKPFRFGGEEMCILAPISAEEAVVLAERVRNEVASIAFEKLLRLKEPVKATVSVGVATSEQTALQLKKGDNDEILYDQLEIKDEADQVVKITDVNQLFNSADTCLYAAKNNGRNNVVYRNKLGELRFIRDGQDMSRADFKKLNSEPKSVDADLDDSSAETSENETTVEQVFESDENVSNKSEGEVTIELDRSLLNKNHIENVIDTSSEARIELEWASDDSEKAKAMRELTKRKKELSKLQTQLKAWEKNAEVSAAEKVLIGRMLPKIDEELAEALAVVDGLSIAMADDEFTDLMPEDSGFVERRQGKNNFPVSTEALLIIDEVQTLQADIEEVRIEIEDIQDIGRTEYRSLMGEYDGLLKDVAKLKNVYSNGSSRVMNEDAVVEAVKKFEIRLEEVAERIKTHENKLSEKDRIIKHTKRLLPELENLAGDLIRYSPKHEKYRDAMKKFHKKKKEAEELLLEELNFDKDMLLSHTLSNLEERKDDLFNQVKTAKKKYSIISEAATFLKEAVEDEAMRSNDHYLKQYNDILASDMTDRMRTKSISALRNSKIQFSVVKIAEFVEYMEKNSLSARMADELVEVLVNFSSSYVDIENITGKGNTKSKQEIDALVTSIKSSVKDGGETAPLSFTTLVKYISILNQKFLRTADMSLENELSDEDFEQSSDNEVADRYSNELLKDIKSREEAVAFIASAYNSITLIEERMLQLRTDAAKTVEAKYKEEIDNEYKQKYKELTDYTQALAILINEEFLPQVKETLDHEITDVVHPIALENFLLSSMEQEYVDFRNNLQALAQYYVDFGMIMDRLTFDSSILDQEDYMAIANMSFESFFEEIKMMAETLDKDGGDPQVRRRIEMEFADRSSVIDIVFKYGTNLADSYQFWPAHTAIGLLKNKLDSYRTKLSTKLEKFPESSPKMDDVIPGTIVPVEQSPHQREAHRYLYKKMDNMVKGSTKVEAKQMDSLKSLDESGVQSVVNGGPPNQKTVVFFKPTDEYLKRYRDVLPWFARLADSETPMMVYRRKLIVIENNMNALHDSFNDFIISTAKYSDEAVKAMNDYFYKLVILQGGREVEFNYSDKICNGELTDKEKDELFQSYAEFIDLSLNDFYEKNKQNLQNLNIEGPLSPQNFVRAVAQKVNVQFPKDKFTDADLIIELSNAYPYFNYDSWSFLWSVDRTGKVLKENIYTDAKLLANFHARNSRYDYKSSRLYSNFVNGMISDDTVAQFKEGKQYLEQFHNDLAIAELPEVEEDETQIIEETEEVAEEVVPQQVQPAGELEQVNEVEDSPMVQEHNLVQQADPQAPINSEDIDAGLDNFFGFAEDSNDTEIETTQLTPSPEQTEADRIAAFEDAMAEFNAEVDAHIYKIGQYAGIYLEQLEVNSPSDEASNAYHGAVEVMENFYMQQYREKYGQAQIDFKDRETEIALGLQKLKTHIEEAEKNYAARMIEFKKQRQEQQKRDAAIASEITQALPNIQLFAQRLVDEYKSGADTVAETQALFDESVKVIDGLDEDTFMVLIDDVRQIINKVEQAKADHQFRVANAVQETQVKVEEHIVYLDMNAFAKLADELKDAYDSFADNVEELEANVNAILEKVETGQARVAENAQDAFENLIQELSVEQDSYKEDMEMFSSSVKVDGGLSFEESNSTVSGSLGNINWKESSIGSGQAMTFDVLSFKKIDRKTVLASL